MTVDLKEAEPSGVLAQTIRRLERQLRTTRVQISDLESKTRRKRAQRRLLLDSLANARRMLAESERLP